MHISKVKADVPFISTGQMIEVDRLMTEVYQIRLIQMMENAGRCLAILTRHLYPEILAGQNITVLAGTGGNGGGALVAARRLVAWGADVQVRVSKTSEMKDTTAHQYRILQRMGLDIQEWSEQNEDLPDSTGLILDGILGYSLSAEPRGKVRNMISRAARHQAPKISLDTPSGIDLSERKIYEPVIRAAATLTLAMPKDAFLREDIRDCLGALYLADISVPPKLYAEPSLKMNVSKTIFQDDDILQIF